MTATAETAVVAMLVYEGCDLMDVAGPYEVLLTADRLRDRDGLPPLFDVRTVSLDGALATACGGLGLTPSHGALGDQDVLDVLMVPGLIALDAALADDHLIGAIRSAGTRAAMVTSICTGAFLLDAAGLLDDVPATTHWEDAPLLARQRDATVKDDVRWVDAGHVITGGGLSSGIAMTLHLVARIGDRALAEATARQIDYVWTETR